MAKYNSKTGKIISYQKTQKLVSETLHVELPTARLIILSSGGAGIAIAFIFILILTSKSKLQKKIEKICGLDFKVKFKRKEIRLYATDPMTEIKHEQLRNVIKLEKKLNISSPEEKTPWFGDAYYQYLVIPSEISTKVKLPKLKEGQVIPAVSETGSVAMLDFYRYNSFRFTGPSGCGKTQAALCVEAHLSETTKHKTIFFSVAGSIGLSRKLKDSAEIINSTQKETVLEKLRELKQESDRRQKELEFSSHDHYRFIQKDSGILIIFDELESTLTKKDGEIVEIINYLLATSRKSNIWLILITQSSQLSVTDIKQSLISISFAGKMTSKPQADVLGLDFDTMNRNDLVNGKLICVGLFEKPEAVQFRRAA